MSSKIIIPIAVAISVIVTAGIMYAILDQNVEVQVVTETPEPEIIYVDKSVSEFFDGTNEIKQISSQEELVSILEASSLFGGGFYDTRVIRSMAVDDGVMMESEVPTLGAPEAKSSTQSGTDYSTTNVQVENVDEPDYLKNDDKYVYIVSRKSQSLWYLQRYQLQLMC